MGNLSKSDLVGFVAIALAGVSAVLSIFGYLRASVFFFALVIAGLLLIVVVSHRYLVSSRRHFDKQINALKRQNLEDQGEVMAALAGTRPAVKTPPSRTADRAVQKREKVHPTARQSKQPSSSTISSETKIYSKFSSLDQRKFVVSSIVKDPDSAVKFALRTQSRQFVEYMALAATGMAYGIDGMVELLARYRGGEVSESATIRQWDKKLLLRLAWVLGNLRATREQAHASKLIYTSVAKAFGPRQLEEADVFLLAEVIGRSEGWENAVSVLRHFEVDRFDLTQVRLTDANSYSGTKGDSARWLKAVNPIYLHHGLEPLSIVESDVPSIDRITCQSQDRVDGPLVSVIVPTYEGAGRIDTALRSLREQTWKNLEVIVVDDGSSEPHILKLREVVGRYPNARLVELQTNQGAYVARNAGLEVANGEYITVHDDDDWSHPRKIELQITALIEDDDAVATVSKHIRVTENLEFTRINARPRYLQDNMSSLMVTRKDLLQVGGWDEVNRGADEEFTLRLKLLTGGKVLEASSAPLSFTRTHQTSLTAGEVLRGYQDPARLFYYSAFRLIHNQISIGDSFVRKIEPRALNMQPGKRNSYLGKFDVVYVVDLRLRDTTSVSALKELRQLAEAGYRVGVAHLYAFDPKAAYNFHVQAMVELQSQGIEYLTLTDRIDVDLVVVRDPRVLEFADARRSSWRSSRVVIADGFFGRFQQQRSSLMPSVASVAEIWGQSVAEEVRVRKWRGLAPGVENIAQPKFEGTPLIGRGPTRRANEWPKKASDVSEVYNSNDVYSVLLVDDLSALPERTRTRLAESADVLAPNQSTIEELFSRLDFLVIVASDPQRISSGEVASAITSGRVVILPPAAKSRFGMSALYGEPKDIMPMIRRVWQNPKLYLAQVERARKFLGQYWENGEFLEEISGLLTITPTTEA